MHVLRPASGVVTLLAAGLAACGGNGGAPVEQKLVITGSSTLAPLVADIGKRFEVLHAGARIDVQTGGSSRGIADVRGGLADIGMASRALAASESDLRAFPIARDGVCLFVHRDNPVAELSDQQVVAIYTGELTNWRQLAGQDLEITVVSKAEGRATLRVFLDYFGLDNRDIAPDVIVGDNEQGVKTVIGDPAAIAYVSIGTAEYHVAQGEPIRLLATAGVAASTANVATGSFPLDRPLNLLTSDDPSGLVREFLDFALSAEVHDLIREHHSVPIGKT